VKYEVHTAVKVAVLFFWLETSCRLVGRDQRFGETYRLHLQDFNVDSVSPESRYLIMDVNSVINHKKNIVIFIP
jgi:hypothetical protein